LFDEVKDEEQCEEEVPFHGEWVGEDGAVRQAT
jgi:hypothetical protein